MINMNLSFNDVFAYGFAMFAILHNILLRSENMLTISLRSLHPYPDYR